MKPKTVPLSISERRSISYIIHQIGGELYANIEGKPPKLRKQAAENLLRGIKASVATLSLDDFND